jgi:hypothetical protein
MWKYYNPNPRGNNYAGDCVIRAISRATGKEWGLVFAGLSLNGYFSGDWGNSNGVWDSYLRKLGYKRYILPNTCPYCYTVDDFSKDYSAGVYILGTGTHAVAVVDGDYYDSWDSGNEVPIYFYTMEEL